MFTHGLLQRNKDMVISPELINTRNRGTGYLKADMSVIWTQKQMLGWIAMKGCT